MTRPVSSEPLTAEEEAAYRIEAEASLPTLTEHKWISNPAFYRMTGVKWVCMDCRIGVARRSDVVRRSCPGRAIQPTGSDR